MFVCHFKLYIKVKSIVCLFFLSIFAKLFNNQDINPLDDGEDERSTDQHVSVIKQECQKTRPNVDVIQTHLRKIQKYRTHYILQHTTEEVLREFPCLTIPVVVSVLSKTAAKNNNNNSAQQKHKYVLMCCTFIQTSNNHVPTGQAKWLTQQISWVIKVH